MVKKWVSNQSDTLLLDTLSIVPNTFYIANIPATNYKLDIIKATLIWITKPVQDSTFVSYRTFPYKLYNKVQLYNFDSVRNNFLVTPYSPKVNDGTNQIFDLGTVEYTGSFGRGISFGNAQNAVFNSNLNLQLSGYVGDSIEIAASLSDQNLPIQPDGSTTQLNEIDKIFIQFKKNKTQLDIGDIDLRQQHHYYLNFYKRLQGLAFQTSTVINKNITNNVLISGALAKGKFTTNTFQGIEGNQGPYRLQGANNEFFFIVLANTERVYIDGELQQRGEDQDYIINYNNAEITFTPTHLITKDKRIRVEFEYSDRNYLNSQLYATNQLVMSKKLQFRLSAYSNIDAKNSPLNQPLDALQKKYLATVGDSINSAYYPTANLDTLTAGKILYKKIDTLVNGIPRSIYQYTTNKDSAKYSLTFADLGQGNADYQILLNGANGKVFVWVAPINGIKQGRFDAVQYLITPKKQQVISLSTSYIINKYSNLNAELATTINDINTFSNNDKTNDNGFAGKLQWKYEKPINTKTNIATIITTEYNNKNFKTIERLRSAEYNRDWNLPQIVAIANEQLHKVEAKLNYQSTNSVSLQMSNYKRSNGYNGLQQTITTSNIIKGWQANTNFSYTNTNDNELKGLFVRPTIDIIKTFKKIKNYQLNINYFLENKSLTLKTPDTLSLESIAFSSLAIGLQSNPAKDNKWGFNYINRINKIPIYQQLVQSDKSSDIELSTQLLANEHHKFLAKATYRNLQVALPQKVSYQSDKTLLGRAEYQMNELKGVLITNVIMETGSGQEQRRDFAYLEVPTGQGEYYWIDYNNNTTQELNEFELALFPDQKKFIKIFIPTNQYIKANFNTLNYSMAINPRAKLTQTNYKGFKNILSRLYLQSNLQISKKEQTINKISVNPFKYDLQNSNLLTLNNTFANSFSFNKYNTKWGVDVNQDARTNKALLTYGYETRVANTYVIKERWNIKKIILVEQLNKLGTNKLATPSFNNRNYEVQQKSAELKVAYTQKTTFRIGVNYQLEKKQNSIQFGGEVANINSLGFDAKYNALQSTAVNAKFTYSNISYTGLPNTTVSYIMLDALLPGKNYLWNVDIIKTLRNNIELNIRYEGRKTGATNTVHIGSVSLRASFY